MAEAPNSQSSSQPPLNLDKEVDLIEYLNAILRAKYRILVFAILVTFAVFGASKLKDDIFVSTAVVGININEEPGGITPGNYRGSDTLALLEYDFIIQRVAENQKERLITRMRSTRFSEIFIDQNNLLPYIYAKHWDAEAKEWLNDFKPVKLEAIKNFQNNIRALQLDDASGLLLVHFKTRDPNLSAELANRFVSQFNSYYKGIEADELQARRDFLESKLDDGVSIETQRSINRMLEAQLSAEVLLEARKFYPLEEIQPAVVPLYKSTPNRKSMAIAAFIGSLFMGVVVVLGWTVISKLRSALQDYKQRSTSTERDGKASAAVTPPDDDESIGRRD